ncbi:hypothetical protein [Mycetocola saprophilus]|uniref:hypothetical protein n=1 Tax=Mycetocola saprophilus TaxID=76636 RepID=UPI003BF0B7DE
MSNPVATLIAQVASDIPQVQSYTATFVRMDKSFALVNIGPNTVPARCSGFYPPVTGMTVQVIVQNGQLIVVGPAVPLHPLGKIKSAQTPKATVTVDGKDYLLGVRVGYTPVVGDDVEINWTTGVIQSKIAGAPTPEPPPTGGGSSAPFSGLLVQASASGNWWTGGPSWNSTDPWASTSNTGAWFYGTAIQAALAGASISSAEVYLPAQNLQGTVSLGLHPHPDQPPGAPAVSSLAALGRATGWVPLPAGFAESLQNGSNRGIAVRSTNGFNRFSGVPRDPLSGAMRFAGTR